MQVIATVLSMNTEIDPDIPALLGASAALALSGLPFMGPIAAARVGYKDGQYLLNPTSAELQQSKLDLVVAGTQEAVLMVESQADRLPEDVMLGAVMFGHEQMQVAIEAIRSLAKEVGRPPIVWTAPVEDKALASGVAKFIPAITDAYGIAEKQVRYAKIGELKKQCVAELTAREGNTWTPAQIDAEFHDAEKNVVRSRIIAGKPRIDGRDTKTVRKIDVQVGILPRTHGSAIFTRGETQALVVTTLGTGRDAQIIDALEGERKDPFMLHYNFPPYSVGETGFIGSPKRREIGHGRLARRGVEAIMPDMETFPYVIRVVSEITESNGSSSMASVCGTSLSLMDAGVPIKAPVAGVAMGLIKEPNAFVVLTDILGDEDHLGDMDFKVAGTADGVTALQMDIKIFGITREIMATALAQARDGRLHILGEMNKVLKTPREKMSDWAPTIITIKIDPEKIRDVIGKGGAVIRAITEETGATIDIENDGTVKIASVDGKAGRAAVERIELITADVEVGRIYRGQGCPAHGFRRVRHDPAGPRRPRAHLADLQRARRARERQAQRRRRRARQGPRGRPPGPRALEHARRRRRVGLTPAPGAQAPGGRSALRDLAPTAQRVDAPVRERPLPQSARAARPPARRGTSSPSSASTRSGDAGLAGSDRLRARSASTASGRCSFTTTGTW